MVALCLCLLMSVVAFHQCFEQSSSKEQLLCDVMFKVFLQYLTLSMREGEKERHGNIEVLRSGMNRKESIEFNFPLTICCLSITTSLWYLKNLSGMVQEWWKPLLPLCVAAEEIILVKKLQILKIFEISCVSRSYSFWIYSKKLKCFFFLCDKLYNMQWSFTAKKECQKNLGLPLWKWIAERAIDKFHSISKSKNVIYKLVVLCKEVVIFIKFELRQEIRECDRLRFQRKRS